MTGGNGQLAVAVLASEVGVNPAELLRLLRYAGWDAARVREARRASREWCQALLRDGRRGEASAIAERTTDRMRKILSSGGPDFAAAWTESEIASRLKHPRLQALLANYDPHLHGGRLVCGPTDIGKTLTAIGVVRRFAVAAATAEVCATEAEARVRARLAPTGAVWVRSFDLPNARLKQPLGDGEAPLVERALSAPFLVLDDLSWESSRAAADDVVGEVLAARYDSGLLTYVSSGHRREKLMDRYGDALVRRIEQAGGKAGKSLELWDTGVSP